MEDSTILIDTGSADLLLASTACKSIPGCNMKRLFNPSKSSTYKNTGQTFQIQYGDGSTAVGSIATDTVAVAGLAVPQQSIGLADHQNDNFGFDQFDGVLGMAFPSDSATGTTPYFFNLVANKKVDQPVYGLYLPPWNDGQGELTLGGYDKSKITGKLINLPMNQNLIQESGWFIVNFAGIATNGKSTGIAGSALFDTGTSGILAPSQAYAKAIFNGMSPVVTMSGSFGRVSIPCSMVTHAQPYLDFTLGSMKLRVPSSQLIVGPNGGDDSMCDTIIEYADDGEEDLWVLGNEVLRYYYSVWNVSKQQLSLATTRDSPSY